ncbi:MAG: hypothetical protein AAFQ65_09805 [Myxococcota bacterium]
MLRTHAHLSTLAVVLLGVACGRTGFEFSAERSGSATDDSDAPPSQEPIDAPGLNQVFCRIPSDERVFAEPEPLSDIRGLIEDSSPTRFGIRFDPTFSSDGLTLFFSSDHTGWAVWRATRPTLNAEFDNLAVLGDDVNRDSASEFNFHLRDTLGIAVIFSNYDDGGGPLYEGIVQNNGTIAWSSSTLNAALDVGDGRLSNDALTLYFTVGTPSEGRRALYTATRSSAETSFADPGMLISVNTDDSDDSGPFPTAGGHALLLATNRSGGLGDDDIWLAERRSLEVPFEEPQPLTVLNSPEFDGEPTVLERDDGCEIVFVSSRGAEAFQLYRSFVRRSD